jgi:purine-cytosine permease-like protein
LGVTIAGWTTANPTLYRVGLALQTVTPNWPRWKITLVAGVVTAILACFPVFFLKLLDYVALYGLVLMPIGAIVVAEHWLFPRLNLPSFRAERDNLAFNWQVLVIWFGTLAVCYFMPFHLYFRWLPGWFLAVIGYTLLVKATAKEESNA